jgi:uncharacterized protein YndB with AHSA1/START domain
MAVTPADTRTREVEMQKVLVSQDQTPEDGSQDSAEAGPVSALVAIDATRNELEHFERDLPPLYGPGASARTIARDRWERIVSSHDIDAPIETVWAALTEPGQMARWFFGANGSLLEPGVDRILDTGDGDFFLTRTLEASPPNYLEWRWRWLGIGPAWSVKWYLENAGGRTRVVVVDEALNPPARTGHYRGEGWPEILEGLATYLRTGFTTRWRPRSQSFALVELPVTLYAAWDRLFTPESLKWWLHGFTGEVQPGQSVEVHIGDASGSVELAIEHVLYPAYNVYPAVTFSMKKRNWPVEVPGRIFLEPAGWGSSILQVYQTDWEHLGPAYHPTERATIVAYWADAFRRASELCASEGIPGRASPWVTGDIYSDPFDKFDDLRGGTRPAGRPAAPGES